MKSSFNWWLLLWVMFFVAACSDGGEEIDNPDTPPTPEQPTITLGTSTSDFTTNGGSNTVSFTASTDWTAEVINSRADAWCSVTPTSGKAGNAQITIITTANDTPDDRSASVILKVGTTQKTITVSQKQKDALTVTSSKFEVEAAGGEVKIEVKANIDFQYEITYGGTAKDWISTTDSRALKTSTLGFKVAANEEVEKREATVTVKSGSFKEEVKIYQAGSTPSITLTKNEFVVASAGESIAVEVKSNVDVTVELPTDVDWISENQSRAMSTNTYHFTITESQEYDQRSAGIRFINKANNLSDTVKIVQVQKDAIVVAKNEYEFKAEGGKLDFEIQTNVDVTVAIPDSISSWVQQVKSRALVSQTLHFDIAANEFDNDRSGTITLTGGNAVQKILIKQEQMKIDPATIPDNEIWYRTIDNKIYDIYHCTNTYGNQPFNTSIISHTYEKGLGVIKCKETITAIEFNAFGNVFGNSNLSELYLPETIEVISNEGISNNQYLTTLRIPKNLKSIQGLNNPNLTLLTGAHVSEDGRCIIIDEDLKAFAPKGIKIYKTPAGVKSIGADAFAHNNELEEIIISEGITSIGGDAFYRCNSLRKITFPLSLTSLHPYAFNQCSAIEGYYGNEQLHTPDHRCLIAMQHNPNAPLLWQGKWILGFAGVGITDYTIPEGIVGIENYAFSNQINLKSITLSNSIVHIGSYAFEGCLNLEKVYGVNVTEDNRAFVYNNKFGPLIVRKNIPKDYHIPDNITSIEYQAFNNCTQIQSITMGDQIIEIGGYAFAGCSNLREITLSANLRRIGGDWHTGNNPFYYSNNLEKIYCRALVPPAYYDEQMSEFPLLKFYVPEQSLTLYQNNEGWSLYKKYFIGYKYNDLGNNDYYVSSDFSQNRKVTTLQTATKGNGIDIVLMGDAYSDRQITDGTYQTDMEYIYNNLFTEEPYKSFKDHFNVYYVNVVSATEGYEHGGAALGGFFGEGTLVGGNDKAVFTYALNAISESQMDKALIIVAMNSNNYAGTCYMYNPEIATDYGNGTSVAYFPKGENTETFAQILHHEACGHGFAKLADEYAYEDMGAVSADYVSQKQTQQTNWGWWKNVDFTNDTSTIRWNHFISDTRYANEGLGAYEGGLTYWKGVWRPTENSIMRHNTGGFNAPSREAIYYRIHKLAYGKDWQYDYEKFVEYDVINRKKLSARSIYKPTQYKPLHAPIVKHHSWKNAK